MPYGQILEIMVALILISSAPEHSVAHLSPVAALGLWFLKAIFWYLICHLVFRKRDAIGGLKRLELWEWAALLPFTADIYFLDINLFIGRISSSFGLESLREILGLILFFFYLSVVWSTGLKKKRERLLLNRTVYSKLRLLLPMVLPYFILIVLADLLEKLPVPFIKSWLSSDYSPLIFFILFLLFFLFVLPPLIVRLWKCTPLPASELRFNIEQVLKKQKTSFSNIMVWTTGETMACTAAVMGIIPGFRYILLTPCLIRFLLPEEIEAVIAHEVEHVKKKHILWYVIFIVSYSAVLYRLGDPFITWLLSSPAVIELLMFTDQIPESLISLLGALPIGILIVLYFRFLIGYFMRNFERQADMAAFRVHGHPFFMINALKKVAALSGIDPERPNWHHYSIAQRINFLERAFADKNQLMEHDRKLIWSKIIFLSLICLLLVLPSALPTRAWKTEAHTNILQLYFEKLTRKDEKNPRWFLLLGEMAFEQKRYKEAELAYKKVLKLQPGNAEALNNLAWLYVKTSDPHFRRPRQALLLAMEAARLKPAPYILDTLAECFFENGYVKLAMNTEIEALKKAHKNRDYYKKQLEKFRGTKDQQRIN